MAIIWSLILLEKSQVMDNYVDKHSAPMDVLRGKINLIYINGTYVVECYEF